MKRAVGILAGLWLAMTPALWAQQQPADAGRLVDLTSQLLRASERLNINAQRNRQYTDVREDAVLRKVFELHTATQWFALQVDRYSNTLDRTRDDFTWLAQTYQAAATSLGERALNNDIQRDLRSVESLLDRLYPIYGQSRPGRIGRVGDEARPGGWRGSRRGSATLPAGSILTMALDDPIRSRDMRTGERFPVSIANDVMLDDRLVIPAGTTAVARVTELDDAGRVKGREHISFELVELNLDDKKIPVSTNVITYVAEGSKERDASVIGGSAVLGAIIGAIGDGGEGALKGAAIGAAAGTGVVLATKGETVQLAAGHRIEFTLEEDLSLDVERERRWDRDDSDDVSRRY